MTEPRPISECTQEDLKRHHALVYGRCKLWRNDLTDEGPQFHWSNWAWWKAMHYSHRGPPCYESNWGIYAGSGGGAHTGPGDAQITHFLPMPDVPAVDNLPAASGDAA